VKRLYLAGASAELVLVEAYMRRVRDAGHEITWDWCATVRRIGASNPHDAKARQRLAWCAEDLGGVDTCDVFWLLVPQAPSVGCWVEMGVAWQQDKRIVMSGEWRGTIFSALADELYDSHELALSALLAEAA
jgi:hypothetical protein